MGRKRKARAGRPVVPDTLKLNKPTVGKASPKGIRVPVPKLHYPGINKDTKRTLTVGQLAVLLWCLQQCSLDDNIGYLDAEHDLNYLMSEVFNKRVHLDKLDLERLLWAGNLAELHGFFVSPDGKSFEEFIRPMLFIGEAFDRQWNLLLDVDGARKFRNKRRFIKSMLTKRYSKKE